MAIRTPLVPGEWYHCYNRGVDKRRVFESKRDYERFVSLLYLGNSSLPIHFSNLKQNSLNEIISDDSIERGEPLVDVGVYALMPNHFHFLLKEIHEGGITTFMQKVCTAYTMYFNKKNQRTGALFGGPFKSKHVPDDRYFKHLVAYVHMNPIELFEPEWKSGHGLTHIIEKQLGSYPYSSLPDFFGERPEKKILGESIFDFFNPPSSISKMLKDAQLYYQENIKASP